jgi:hypothetical protein
MPRPGRSDHQLGVAARSARSVHHDRTGAAGARVRVHREAGFDGDGLRNSKRAVAAKSWVRHAGSARSCCRRLVSARARGRGGLTWARHSRRLRRADQARGVLIFSRRVPVDPRTTSRSWPTSPTLACPVRCPRSRWCPQRPALTVVTSRPDRRVLRFELAADFIATFGLVAVRLTPKLTAPLLPSSSASTRTRPKRRLQPRCDARGVGEPGGREAVLQASRTSRQALSGATNSAVAPASGSPVAVRCEAQAISPSASSARQRTPGSRGWARRRFGGGLRRT